MPNIQSAIKKVRKDAKRAKLNTYHAKTVKQTMKNMSKIKDKSTHADEVSRAYAVIDKAAKKGIIHKNKAARLKSQVSR